MAPPYLFQRTSTPSISPLHSTPKFDRPLSSPPDFEAIGDVAYREAVGAPNWAALATRLDIALAVAKVARFSVNSGLAHWNSEEAVHRGMSSLMSCCYRKFDSEGHHGDKVGVELSVGIRLF